MQSFYSELSSKFSRYDRIDSRLKLIFSYILVLLDENVCSCKDVCNSLGYFFQFLFLLLLFIALNIDDYALHYLKDFLNDKLPEEFSVYL